MKAKAKRPHCHLCFFYLDDLGVDDLGVDDLGVDDLGVDDLGDDAPPPRYCPDCQARMYWQLCVACREPIRLALLSPRRELPRPREFCIDCARELHFGAIPNLTYSRPTISPNTVVRQRTKRHAS